MIWLLFVFFGLVVALAIYTDMMDEDEDSRHVTPCPCSEPYCDHPGADVARCSR